MKKINMRFLVLLMMGLGILIAGFSCSGKIGGPNDIIQPTVTFVSPLSGATGVPINQKISGTFSEEMNPLTITNSTFILMEILTGNGTRPVLGRVTYTGVTAVYNTESNLKPNTRYSATITNKTKDLAGNTLAVAKTWTFTTSASGAVDTTAPTVTFISPVSGTTGVPINQKISAIFSEVMDPLTITNANFTLKKNGTTAVSGKITYTGVTAVFQPASNLSANTTYTATITTSAKDLAGNALAFTKIWTFTTSASGAVDTTAPIVSSTEPSNLETDVAINANISAIFSEVMDPLTISNVNFILKKNGTTAVSGEVTYTGVTAVFNPDSNLSANSSYTATITTSAKDLAGNNLAVAKTWTFTTSASGAVDTTAPTVISTAPANLETNVAINRDIGAIFSEFMDPLTISNVNFTLKKNGTTAVLGEVTYTGVTAVFNPDSNLSANTTYTATITTSAKDLAGNNLAVAKTWTFTTSASGTVDTTAPTVISTAPANLETDVAINRDITAIFSEEMNPLTITNANFTLKKDGTTAVSGEVTYTGVTAVFNPDSNLSANSSYTATITTSTEDLAGNNLAVNKTWTFTTATAPAAGPAPVNLGTAGNYVILSKTGIASLGTTVVGNMGVSPIAGTAITGFSLTMDGSNTYSTSAQVTGKIYAANYTAPTPANLTTAISDMETAYTDAAGRANPTATELGSGEIGGMTLVPGLYKWSTSLTISTDLYLSGNANDVWIFEVAQNLNLANGITVHLSGGAQAKNIYWQIKGNTVLGTTSVMYGNMICKTDMTMKTNSRLIGRLLAQTAVTLQVGTRVTLP